MDRLRRDPRAAAPRGPVAVGRVLRLRHAAPPFDDVRVRQAFAQAVDWRRIVAPRLARRRRPRWPRRWSRRASPAGATRTSCPTYDPAAARTLLAEAGYPGGAGFPAVTLHDGGGVVRRGDRRRGQARARRRARLRDDGASSRTSTASTTDPPAIWSLGWVADYPGRNDFLGVLLGTGSTNNYGRWTLRRVRRGDRRSAAAADRRRGRGGRVRPGRDASSATRRRSSRSPTARAGRCRGRAAGRRAERARASSGWRASRGPTDAPDRRRGLARRRLLAVGRRGCRSRPRRPIAARSGPRRATGTFGQDIEFRQPVTVDRPLDRVELLVTYAGRARPDGRSRCPDPPAPGALDLRLHADLADAGHILPNTPITAPGGWRRPTATPAPARCRGRTDREPGLRGRPVRLADRRGRRRARPLVRGRRRVRAAGARDRRGRRRTRRPRCSA